MHLVLLLLLSLVVPASSGVPREFYVHNPTEAPPGSHPWLLGFHSVFRNGYGDLTRLKECGASLIRLSESDTASDIAVTAAHCVSNEPQCRPAKDDMFQDKYYTRVVYIGNENMTYDMKQTVEVANFTCNPLWMGSFKADIAVLKLATPIQFNTIVTGIELPKKGEVVKPGTTCKVAGWGYTDYVRNVTTGKIMGKNMPRRLQEAEVAIADDEDCAKYQAQNPEIEKYEKETIICAFPSDSGDRHPLGGDSGGALVCLNEANRPVLHGVISHGYYDDAPVQKPRLEVAIYTEVSFYADWISEAIQSMRGRIRWR